MLFTEVFFQCCSENNFAYYPSLYEQQANEEME